MKCSQQRRNRTAAIIPAGGSGQRMGGEVPKLLLPLGGSTVVQKTLDIFLNHDAIDKVVVPVPEAHLSEYQSLLSKHEKLCCVVGGQTRQESVWKGLCQLKEEGFPDEGALLVHDAARPCVSEELISAVCHALLEHPAVTLGIPSVDSLKRVDSDGFIVESLDRSEIHQVQTPQGFQFSLLYERHEQLANEGSFVGTDDASLVEGLVKVVMLPGDITNRKLTTPEDYNYIKSIVRPS